MLDETEIIYKICNILRSYKTSYRLEERDDILKVSFYKKDKNIVIVNYRYYNLLMMVLITTMIVILLHLKLI